MSNANNHKFPTLKTMCTRTKLVQILKPQFLPLITRWNFGLISRSRRPTSLSISISPSLSLEKEEKKKKKKRLWMKTYLIEALLKPNQTHNLSLSFIMVFFFWRKRRSSEQKHNKKEVTLFLSFFLSFSRCEVVLFNGEVKEQC